MSSPRMKLPSISELTSATAPVLPQQVCDTNNHNGPVFSEARRPSILASSTSSMSPGSISPQTHNYMVPHIVPSYTQYSYGHESNNHPPVFQNYGPPTYMPPSGMPSMMHPGGIFPPVQGQNPAFDAPEVINKPMNECHRCGTTETPEWRRGPNGLRTLCNACGLFHAKLVKKKGAALAAAEVLNNKVYKGKNGRRVRAKKYEVLASKPQVVDFPPISQTPVEDYVPRYQQPNLPHALYKPYAHFLPALCQYSRAHLVMSPPRMPYPEISMAALRN